jgi:hypothetical protein
MATTNGIPGCKCSGKRGESCTRSGWIRCNERLTWLAKEAKKHGLSKWSDMNAVTNTPRVAALRALRATVARGP